MPMFETLEDIQLVHVTADGGPILNVTPKAFDGIHPTVNQDSVHLTICAFAEEVLGLDLES